MDRPLLVLSSLCFLSGFGWTIYALSARVQRPSRFNFGAILCGFAFQTAFLYQRGQEIGRCPLTNLFEVLIFLSWSMGLLYFVVGPAYRLSLLGFFTSPLVFLLQVGAMLLPIDRSPARMVAPNPWLELHAAISVIAYGAFALACVAGIMYLAQERQLKTHQIRSMFYHLPPISVLAVANRRLLWVGFILLSAGMLAGLAVGQPLDAVKVGWSIGVWLLYAAILQAGRWRPVSPRKVAVLSIAAFSLTLSTLWSLNFIA